MFDYQDSDFAPDPSFGFYEDADITHDPDSSAELLTVMDEKLGKMTEMSSQRISEYLRILTYYEKHPIRAMIKGMLRMKI